MANGYEFAEYRHFREYGGVLLPDRSCEMKKNTYFVEWPVHPAEHFHDHAEMRLLFRQPLKRMEVVHVTLILRGDYMLRLDTNHPHREGGVVRKGHHVHWKEDSNSKQKTSFDLMPPLDFPETIHRGEKAEYWRVLEWFCSFSNIDTSRVDLSDLEAVKE